MVGNWVAWSVQTTAEKKVDYWAVSTVAWKAGWMVAWKAEKTAV